YAARRRRTFLSSRATITDKFLELLYFFGQLAHQVAARAPVIGAFAFQPPRRCLPGLGGGFLDDGHVADHGVGFRLLDRREQPPKLAAALPLAFGQPGTQGALAD